MTLPISNRNIAFLAVIWSMTPLAGAQFVVKPYLQLGNDRQVGSTKSMTLVWHTKDEKADWSVRVRNGGRSGDVKSVTYETVKRTGVPAHRVYIARLSNLLPGQAVKYEVLRNSKSVFSGSTVAPKSASQPYRFVVTGDIGRGTSAQRKMVAAIHSQRPDLVAIAGDVVYPRGTVEEYRKNFFPIANADKTSSTVGAPSMRSTMWVAAPGNHDTAYRQTPGGLAFYDYWIQPLGGPAGGCFTFQYGNSHWTVLDSNPYIDWTKPRNRAWLTVALMRGQQATWNFVLFHHPPYHSSKSHAGDTFMRKVADLLTTYKVDLVFSGHVHNYQRSHPLRTTSKGVSVGKGPVYIVTGAGGAELYDQAQATNKASWKPFTAAFKAGYSFTTIDVREKNLSLRQLSIDGKVLDRLTLKK